MKTPYTPLFLLLLGLALGIIVLASPAHAYIDNVTFVSLVGGNESSTITPLEAKVVGAIQPGYAYAFELHAEALFHCYGRYEGESAAVGVDTGEGTLWAGIAIYKPVPVLPPYLGARLEIEKGKHILWKQELDKTFPCQHNDYEATVKILYHCDNRVDVVIEGQGYSHEYSFYASGEALTVQGMAGKKMSYVKVTKHVKIESCSSNNPWGPPVGGVGKDDDKNNKTPKKIIYAVAGLGALSLLIGLFALARPSSGVVVVDSGKRGMLQLVAALLLGAFLAGGYFAWRLGHHSSGGNDKMVLALAAGFLLFLFLFLLMARRQTEVVVVEG